MENNKNPETLIPSNTLKSLGAAASGSVLDIHEFQSYETPLNFGVPASSQLAVDGGFLSDPSSPVQIGSNYTDPTVFSIDDSISNINLNPSIGSDLMISDNSALTQVSMPDDAVHLSGVGYNGVAITEPSSNQIYAKSTPLSGVVNTDFLTPLSDTADFVKSVTIEYIKPIKTDLEKLQLQVNSTNTQSAVTLTGRVSYNPFDLGSEISASVTLKITVITLKYLIIGLIKNIYLKLKGD